MRQDRHEREALYWDTSAEYLLDKEGKALSDNWFKRRKLVKLLLEYDFTGKSVLEIGCGFGFTASTLLNLHGGEFNYKGTDVSGVFLEQARKVFNLNTQLARADDLPFDDNSFDVCFAFDVLEHIHPDDQGKTATELDRVLKPTAKMFINNPHKDNPNGHAEEIEHPLDIWGIAGLATTLRMDVERIEPYTIEFGTFGQYRYHLIVLSRDEGFETDTAVVANLENGTSEWRTICEVHRDIYQKFGKEIPSMIPLIIEAHRKAKKMDAKLKEYKNIFGDESGVSLDG